MDDAASIDCQVAFDGRLVSKVISLECGPGPHGTVQASAMDELERLVNVLVSWGIEHVPLRHQVGMINRLLFQDQKYRFRNSLPSRDFTLTSTLVEKRGNCLGISTVYAAVSGILGIAVRPLLYTGHIALCCQMNDRRCVIETTRRGTITAVSSGSRRGSDGQPLNGRQLLSVHMSNQAVLVYASHDTETAISLLQQSLGAFPTYAAAWANLAALHTKRGQTQEAASCIGKLLDLPVSVTVRKSALELLDLIMTGAKIPGHIVA